MISLALWSIILWICAGIGARALRRLGARCSGAAEEIPFAAAIGMGALAYLILLIGLAGVLSRWAVLAILVGLAALGWRDMARLAGSVPRAARALGREHGGTRILALFLAVMAALTLIGALAPAGDSDYDSLVYHLAIPKLFLAAGAIRPIPWLTHSNFPFTLDMLYTAGLALRDQSLAKLFHFGCGWLTALAVFAFARRWWGGLAGWIGAAIFVAIPLCAWQMMTAYIEHGLALYTFLALCALALHRAGRREGRSDGAGWLWVAGLMCGWAMGTKMLGGAVLMFAIVALAWSLRSAADRPRAIREIAVFTLIAAAVALPWYLKSFLWTGNPVYPFFFEVFGGRYWTAERAREYAEAQRAFGLGRGPLGFLLLPWNLTMHPQWFFDQPEALRPLNTYVWVFGPLLLAFLPALPACRPVGSFGRLCLWFALFFAAVWFGLTQNGRYLIPMLPGLAACAGLAAARLLARPRLASAAARLALVIGLLVGLLPAVLLAAPAVRVVGGLESEAGYLTRASATYRIFRRIERDTPPQARIMLLGDEPRTFYLRRDCLLGNHADLFSEADLAGPEALLAALERMGVTHLLLHASTRRDMEERSGRIETRLAELAERGTIREVGVYEYLSLWEIAGERSATRSG